jgi:putative endonuclease
VRPNAVLRLYLRAVFYSRVSQAEAGMRERSYWVYILASRVGGTLYIGVTNDLVRRVNEHKNDLIPGFTSEYGVHRLVWYEQHATAESAIKREKPLKKWNRAWKIALFEKQNPN